MQIISAKKMILIDLDGTCLEENGTEMNQITFNYLNILKDQGHIICIVTGRPFRSSQKFYHHLELQTVICNFNASYIHHPQNPAFQPLSFPINASIVTDILREKRIFDSMLNLLVENESEAQCYRREEQFDTYFNMKDPVELKYDLGKLSFNKDFSQWGKSANIIVIKCDSKLQVDEIVIVLTKYSNAIKWLLWKNQNHYLIEISNKFINKGVGARFLAAYYNINLRDVIAYGDEINDFEMIKTSGLGVAMKNSILTLKTVAKDITLESNEQGGVGKHLKTFFDL